LYGKIAEQMPFESTPITGVLGDQSASLLGHACIRAGDIKNTYGTGCFMLMHTGNEVKYSTSGLLTTVAYSIRGETAYAIEGSVAVAGAAVEWLREKIGLVSGTAELCKSADRMR